MGLAPIDTRGRVGVGVAASAAGARKDRQDRELVAIAPRVDSCQQGVEPVAVVVVVGVVDLFRTSYLQPSTAIRPWS